jgi:predicted phosphodiesterase
VSVRTWVILNDLQIPFQDTPILDLVLSFVKDLKPYGVILNGDVVDCYELSEFDKNPLKDAGLEREIRESAHLMYRLAQCTTERWWLGGNHEDRLRRTIWRNPKFARLESLRFEKLFNLEENGFKWKPYGGLLKLGKLVVTHGSTVRQHSGWTARAHYEKLGGSVLIGHTHRLGIYYRTNAHGVHAGYENGCLCRLDPEYVQFPDWQQGFSVVHVDDTNRFFNVVQIPILNRRVLYYGRERYERK